MGETGARRRNRNGARRTCDATHSSTREIMRASSPRARAGVGVNHVRASSARARGVDGGRTLRAATTEVSLNREGLVSSRGTRDGARALVQTRAIDPAGAISAVQGFVLDGSPGLRAAAIANTAVFTSGFGVLRLGLTLAGIAHSWFLGTVVMAAFGVGGYALVCAYFIVGSAVTKIKLKEKQAEGIAEARGGLRGPGSVWGSGTAGILCAIAALSGCTPVSLDLWRIGFVASFCSKLSDTTASEIGKAYGKTTYMSTPPFKLVPRGTEGAVSVEGTGAGIVISGLFAAFAFVIGQLDAVGVGVCVLAAFIATTFESMLGAAVQGRKGFDWMSNDVVNGIQITLAAGVAIAVRTFV